MYCILCHRDGRENKLSESWKVLACILEPLNKIYEPSSYCWLTQISNITPEINNNWVSPGSLKIFLSNINRLRLTLSDRIQIAIGFYIEFYLGQQN